MQNEKVEAVLHLGCFGFLPAVKILLEGLPVQFFILPSKRSESTKHLLQEILIMGSISTTIRGGY